MKSLPELPPPIPIQELKRKTNRAALIAYVTIAFLLGLGSIFVYWTFEPDQVYSLDNKTIRIVPPTGKAGDTIMLEFGFCKLLDLDGTIQRSFVSNNTEILTPATVDQVPKTCIDDLKVPVIVPQQAGPGEYRVKYEGTYKVNPIKTVTETYFSTPFTVVE